MKIKFKIPSQLINLNYLKHLYFIFTLIVLGLFSILGYFLYENLYQTIAQAQEVILKKKEIAPEALDMEQITKTLKFLDEKTTSTDRINLSTVRDPFFYKSTTTPNILEKK
ncbi:MAG: hypothetical protein WCX71_02405 [Candidatus Buchananbacteria bacterium]